MSSLKGASPYRVGFAAFSAPSALRDRGRGGAFFVCVVRNPVVGGRAAEFFFTVDCIDSV